MKRLMHTDNNTPCEVGDVVVDRSGKDHWEVVDWSQEKRWVDVAPSGNDTNTMYIDPWNLLEYNLCWQEVDPNEVEA